MRKKSAYRVAIAFGAVASIVAAFGL